MVENRQKWSNKWSNNRSIVFHWTSYSCQEGSLFTDIHHHISYDMYLSSHTRGIPKKSGPSDQFRTYSGPLLALRSGSGPSPEFRTLLVPLHSGRAQMTLKPFPWIQYMMICHVGSPWDISKTKRDQTIKLERILFHFNFIQTLLEHQWAAIVLLFPPQ